jgi:TetR/AcrR family transcriptional regulator
MQAALEGAGDGWEKVEAVVRSVFRLAARRPELLGLVREVSRLGPPAATRMTLELQPLVRRASEFLEMEMDAGHMRRHDPNLLLLAIYSTVIGMVTEVEVLRAFGEEPTARSLVRRRTDVLQLLRSALMAG